VDYQGMISPISVRGFTGFYLFKQVPHEWMSTCHHGH
jgi:hypothetical protein